jgi:hypothetical protein
MWLLCKQTPSTLASFTYRARDRNCCDYSHEHLYFMTNEKLKHLSPGGWIIYTRHASITLTHSLSSKCVHKHFMMNMENYQSLYCEWHTESGKRVLWSDWELKFNEKISLHHVISLQVFVEGPLWGVDSLWFVGIALWKRYKILFPHLQLLKLIWKLI